MERLLARLLVRTLGIEGVLLLGGGSFVAFGGLTAALGALCLACMGGCCGLALLDALTATPSRAVVAGHHWQRSVEVLVAERTSGNTRWKRWSTERLEGDDLSPVWPSVRDDRCSFPGCQKPGSRGESYSLRLVLADGTPGTCFVSEDRWPQFVEGSEISVRIGGITKAVSCWSSKSAPAPAPKPGPTRGGGKKRRR